VKACLHDKHATSKSRPKAYIILSVSLFQDVKYDLNMITLSTLPVPDIDLSMTLKVIEVV